jgi:hypothetical protein
MGAGLGRGRGRGVDLNKPAWMTTGNLGQAPPAHGADQADGEEAAKQAALAADLRALASAPKAENPAAPSVSAEKGRKRTLEPDDERFAELSTHELLQLLNALPGGE